MKKLTWEARQRFIRAAERERLKRRDREGFGQIYGDLVSARPEFSEQASAKPRTLVPTDQVVLDFSGRLDLVNATESTLAQLDRIQKTSLRLQRTTDIFLDLGAVTSIDAASLLFLCSRVRYFGSFPHLRFLGSYPRSPGALRTFRDANFGDFMSGVMPGLAGEVSNLELASGQSGSRVKPEIGVQMRGFLERRNPALTVEEAANAALAVSECLENVRKHAYNSEGTRRESWYVMGQYEEESQTSSVAILDMGVGIIATISSHLSRTDKIVQQLTGPAEYLDAATRGVLTRSGDPKHGKGLRTVREFAAAAPGRTMHVLSSAGRISVTAASVTKTRTPALAGTIVCLQICNSPTKSLETSPTAGE